MRPVNKFIAAAAVALLLIKFGPNDRDSGSAPVNPGKGLVVLMIEETADRTKLPPEQVQIFSAQSIREYLDAHCEKESNGQPAWRIFDKDTDVTNESNLWRDSMKKPHSPEPWVMISNGRKGVSRPLPKTVSEMETLCKKYGGK